MGAAQSTIVQGEDIKDKYDAGIIDLSYACEKDVICPPQKFISKFTNYEDKYNIYLLIFIFFILFLILILKLKYI